MSLRVVEQAGLTDVGRQRQSNEDNYLESPPVFAVADGMGGARAGEVASRIAVEAFGEQWDRAASPEQQLVEIAKAANREIYELASRDESRAGMGTTLTAIIVRGKDVAIGHVGDSRAYRLRDGELERLTHDHSLVEEFVRQGKLTPEEAQAHPHRSIITRALGPEPDVEVETYTVAGKPGDVYLLCSDGLTGMVPEDKVTDILVDSESLATAAQTLVDMANENGGRDNITVVLCRLAEAEDGEPRDTVVPAPSPAESDHPTRVDPPTDTAVAQQSREVASRSRRVRSPSSQRSRGAGRRASRRAGVVRRRRLIFGACALLVILIVAGAFVALRSVYFIGTDNQGFMALYRGVPYELPLGVALYDERYSSSVQAASLDPAQRSRLLDNSLHSEAAAAGTLRQLEVQAASP